MDLFSVLCLGLLLYLVVALYIGPWTTVYRKPNPVYSKPFWKRERIERALKGGYTAFKL